MVNFKPTICTLVVAALSVALLVWVRGMAAGAEDDRAMLARRLALDALPVDDVNRITLHRAGEEPLVFQRDGIDWLQVEPFAYTMDPYSIRQLIVLARNLQAIDSIEAESSESRGPSTAAGLGLDPPLATIQYEWPAGEMTLRLGRRGVAGRAYLRRTDDSRIFVVSSDLHQRAIEMDHREWRDRRLFHDVSVQDDRILRTDGDQYLELKRDGRRWRIERPVRTRVDQQAFEDLLSVISRAQLSGFVLDRPADLAPFGLAEPVATLEITRGVPQDWSENSVYEGRTQRLLVGQPAGAASTEHFAMIDGQPVVFRLPVTVLQSLFRPATQIAARTGSGVNSADVKTIVIRGIASEFTLQRDLERWIAPDAGSVAVPAAHVEQLLSQFTQLKAPDVQFKPYPRELEVATITLFGFDQSPLDTIRIARDEERKLWAIENGDNVLRVFPDGLELKLSPADYGLEVAGPSTE